MAAVQLLFFTGLVGIASVRVAVAEVFDEQCFELGKQWVYEAKELLLCDRSGRHVNINKFCKAHLTAASGRLIIDSSKDDGPSEPKKQAGHFPDLCLPGQRSYALQSPWLCTCVAPAGGGGSGGHRGRHRWECVVPESGAGRGLGSDNPNSSARMKRSAADGAASSPSPLPAAFAAPTLSSIMSSSVAAETHDAHEDGLGHDGHTHEHNASAAGIRGRQAMSLSRPSIVIDFCDEFGYVHSVTSSMKECACDKDVIATRLFGFKDSDLYQSSSLFSSYECLPGTYNVRCELCYPDTHNCQPAQCP